jgi:bile acid:Na+ symporter, BASS family
MIHQINLFFKTYGKVIGLLATMVVGSLFPRLHEFSFLIQYLLMLMLFFSFLDIEFKPQTFHWSVLWVLLANVAVAFLSYAALVSFDMTFALTAFMTGIAPTAIAAPVIMSFIQGEIEYVVAAVLVTNVSSALIVPLALPFLLGADTQADMNIRISVGEVLLPVLIVMFVPLILARLVSHMPPATQQFLRRGKSYSFLIWLLNLFIISANASNFFRNEDPSSASTLFIIALISLVLCIVNFGVGALLGGRRNWQEASQSLGQKNLSFVIWVALTFINPLVAMGPTFYILYHHLYNSWSIYQFEKRRSFGKFRRNNTQL